jgi:hypothetical protein
MKVIAIAIVVVLLAGCGTGTSVFFGPDGVVITPPTAPIVIPTK